MHRIVQNLILGVFEGFSGDYLEVPFPIDWRIERNMRFATIEVELEFNLPRPNDKRICGISERSVRRPNEFMDFCRNFDRFLLQTYTDFNSRFDLNLIRNVVQMASLSNNNRINRRLANVLTQQVTHYYNYSEVFARYFTFRNLEEETQFYFPSVIGVDPAVAGGDYTITTMGNLEVANITTPHPELVREAQRRVEERIQNILFGEEDPNYFYHQSQTLRRIESERLNRLSEARNNRRRNAPGRLTPLAPFPRYDYQRMRDLLIGGQWTDDQIHEITGQWETDEEAAKIRRKRQEAAERGEKLLKEHLTEQQRADYEATNSFLVVGCDTGRTYRIKKGNHSNIYLLNKKGEEVQGYCFVPAGNLVTGDVLLSQKIELELNEKQALKVANKFEVYRNMNRTVFGQFTL